MNLYEMFLEKKTFSIAIDKDNKIIGVSTCLEQADYGFCGQDVFKIIKEFFVNEYFLNSEAYDELVKRVNYRLITGESGLEAISVTSSKDNKQSTLSFDLCVDVLKKCEIKAMIKFENVQTVDTDEKLYNSIFDDYENVFEDYSDLIHIGKFIIDYTDPNEILYGNENLPNLLDIDKSLNNKYFVTDDKNDKRPYTIQRDAFFKNKYTQLLSGDIEYITDEWHVNNKFLQVELKVYKRDALNKPQIVVGLLFDITRYRQYNNLNQMKQIYDLAITSGNLGIFYYNVERYGKSLFVANDIYASLLGIEPNEMGLFSFEDFEDAIITIEEDITGKDDAKRTLGLVMEGRVDGTTDHILKVRNKKTNEQLYLLSSSKIQSRFDDGSMKEFGGFIINVTARIESEKDKVEFAYKDHLTGLSNKRRLLKDMEDRSFGIGLYMDLDNFKKVNDKYGHNNGDRVLKMFSSALEDVCSKIDNAYPYRLHGDEFFVFIESLDASLIDVIKTELRKHTSMDLVDIKIALDFCCGYSIYNSDKEIDDFIKEADYKMYKEKFRKKSMTI